MKKPRIKLITVASNESLFLPQWIFHHFYMGVDAIDIYLNRNFDNSIEVIHKLQCIFPNLNLHDSDWVDQICTGYDPKVRMQWGVYAYAYFNTCKDFDYIMFIDIDEFIIPRYNSPSLKSLITKLGWPDQIAFEWFCVDGRDDYSLNIFKDSHFHAYLDNNCKSLMKTGMAPDRLLTHLSQFKVINKSVLVDGSDIKIKEGTWEVLGNHQRELKDFFIFHDWMRSPIYYLALLRRGSVQNPGTASGIKSLKYNRTAYNFTVSSAYNKSFSIKFPSSDYKDLENILSGLHIHLEAAKKMQLLLALDCVRILYMDRDDELYSKFTRNLPPLSSLHRTIYDLLIKSDPDLKFISLKEVKEPKNLLTNDIKKTIDNFYPYLYLYPCARDNINEPFYLKELIKYLLDRGLFSEASGFLSNEDLPIWKYFNKSFSRILFARSYEQKGYISHSLEIYKTLQYSSDKEAKDAIIRLMS